jgi:hypothetical protein
MNTKQCLHEAESLERHAKDNLAAWIICGQAYKYGEWMERAYQLRRAAEIKNKRERMEFLSSI